MSKTTSFGSPSREGHDASKYYNSNLCQGMGIIECQDKTINICPQDVVNKILCKSAERMDDLPNNSIHLMVTSPPYNVGKDYDQDLSFEEYLKLLRQVFTETYRVLVNGGRACINVANLGRKPYIPLASYVSILMREIGFNQRGEIIWSKGASSGISCAWGSWRLASNPVLRDAHEYILVFSKGDMKREKEDKVSNISSEDFVQWTKSVWTFPSVSAKKIGHPAPFPEDLPHRLIQLYSFEEDIVLDPFMGSGTTAIASIKNKRNYIGYEISQEYIELSKKRINLSEV